MKKSINLILIMSLIFSYFSMELLGSSLTSIGFEDLMDTIIDENTDAIFENEVNEQKTPSSWAKESVDYLEGKLTIDEIYVQDFQDQITRENFAYFSVLLYNQLSKDIPILNEEGKINRVLDNDTFIDTSDDYVLFANDLGLVTGYGNSVFGSNDEISREQVAVIIIRLLNLVGIRLKEGNHLFEDCNDVSEWAKSSVQRAYANNILHGTGNNYFSPKNKITTEEVYVLMSNVLHIDWEYKNNNTDISNESFQLKWSRGGAYDTWVETAWYSTPASYDINGDGIKDIISAAYSISAIDGNSGQLLWRVASGHDRSEGTAGSDGRTWADVKIADIDDDGQVEIITAHSRGILSVYDTEGYFKYGWPQEPLESEFRGLEVVDLDNDRTMEIIVTAAVSDKRNIWVYEHNGSVREGWPQADDGAGYAYGVFDDNLSVGQLDSDAVLEIIVPSDVHYICAYNDDGSPLMASPLFGDKTWGEVGVWESYETEIKGWGNLQDSRVEKYRPNFALGGSVITDINCDGLNEVIVTGNVYDASQGHPPGLYYGVYIFNSDRTRFRSTNYDWTTGPIDTGAPLYEDYRIIENIQPNPTVYDIDNDGYQEILFASYDGRIHAYSLDKTEHNEWPFLISSYEDIALYGSQPVVYDIDNDSNMEIIFTSWAQKGAGINGYLHILNYEGQELARLSLPDSFNTSRENGSLASVLIDDLDDNGHVEIIVNTIHSGVLVYEVY